MLVALALMLPVLALSGVNLDTPAPATAMPAPPVRPRAESTSAANGVYQIRCWQHGLLLFEDRINLPADAAAYSIRMSGTDRSGKPMYVTETRNATCLVRIAPDESYWPH
jgi:hypothetical protein